MYREDKWFDGVLYHRGTPNEAWRTVSEQGLTRRLQDALQTIKQLHREKVVTG